MTTRRGLGRGLGALIPSAPPAPRTVGGSADAGHWAHPAAREVDGPLPEADDGPGTPVDGSAAVAGDAPPGPQPAGEPLGEVAGATYAELPVDRICPNPRQPRDVFDEDALAELVASIAEVGLLQPVVVRPSGADGYELIMGERRWRAAKEAGLDVIPAIVRDTADENLLRDALLENLHRAQLNPLEEAAAYQQLLEDFGCTHDELAGRIGRSRPQITNTIRLLKLSPAVQRRIAAGVLSAGHARALLGVEDSTAQASLAHRIVAEGLSVRAVEEIVAVGDMGTASRRSRTRRSNGAAPGLADLASRLAERLDTRVKVDLGRSKGKITVEFASLEDLDRIVALMDPADAKASAALSI